MYQLKNTNILPVCQSYMSGEGEIRTLGGTSTTTVFETAPLNHSGTSPYSIEPLYDLICFSLLNASDFDLYDSV